MHLSPGLIGPECCAYVAVRVSAPLTKRIDPFNLSQARTKGRDVERQLDELRSAIHPYPYHSPTTTPMHRVDPSLAIPDPSEAHYDPWGYGDFESSTRDWVRGVVTMADTRSMSRLVSG
jgi:hypothetical protein